MAMPKRNQNHFTVVTTETAPMYPAVIISTVLCVCVCICVNCILFCTVCVCVNCILLCSTRYNHRANGHAKRGGVKGGG